MDGISKQWKCKKQAGHVLGFIERVHKSQNGHKVHIERLSLLRHAIDLCAETPAEVDVVAVIEGFSPTVKCDVPGCGAERTWWPGEPEARQTAKTYAPE